MPDKTDRLKSMELAPTLQPLADRLLNVYRLSLLKAVAHLSNPDNFPMPASEQTIERLFLRTLKKRPQQKQQRAIDRFHRLEAEGGIEKLPEIKRVELRSPESLHAQMMRIPLETKVDFSALISAQVQTKSASIDHSRFSGVRLRLHKAVCEDETNPEGGADNILLGGIAYTTTRSATKLDPLFLGDFVDNEGDVDVEEGVLKEKRFDPPLVLAEYLFADDGVFITKNGKHKIPFGWPREYAFVFMLADQDAGSFTEDFQDIYAKAKDLAIDYVEEEIKKLVGELTEEAILLFANTVLHSTGAGAAAGSAAPGIGNAIGAAAGLIIGWVVATIFDIILQWLEDDLLEPKEVFVTVWSPVQLLTVQLELPLISGQGGLYRLFCDWEFFGKTDSVQEEMRVKESLGPFLSGSFVSTASDFTALITSGEHSLKTAIHNWRGF